VLSAVFPKYKLTEFLLSIKRLSAIHLYCFNLLYIERVFFFF